MKNESLVTKTPTGTITLLRVTGDETEPLMTFTDVPEVEAFYKQRGIAPGITQPTNAISIRVLALDLLKSAESKRATSDPTADETETIARNLHWAANTLQKGDALLCSYELQQATPS